MKNQAEIYQALVNGKCLKHAGHLQILAVKLISGELHSFMNDKWSPDMYNFNEPEKWIICEDPTPKPKKKIYEWLVFSPIDGEWWIPNTCRTEEKALKDWPPEKGYKLKKLREIEIEE